MPVTCPRPAPPGSAISCSAVGALHLDLTLKLHPDTPLSSGSAAQLIAGLALDLGATWAVSVVHRHIVDTHVITENLYRYDPFKRFGADTEIKFTEIDTPPPPAAKK